MGRTGPNSAIAKYGNSFSSMRQTRRKRRLANIDKGRRWSIYFIQADNGPIKIGYARNPYSRLATLQSGNPMRLDLMLCALGDPVTEERLHAAFAGCRQSGEWFAPSEALLAFIGELKLAVDWTDYQF